MKNFSVIYIGADGKTHRHISHNQPNRHAALVETMSYIGVKTTATIIACRPL